MGLRAPPTLPSPSRGGAPQPPPRPLPAPVLPSPFLGFWRPLRTAPRSAPKILNRPLRAAPQGRGGTQGPYRILPPPQPRGAQHPTKPQTLRRGRAKERRSAQRLGSSALRAPRAAPFLRGAARSCAPLRPRPFGGLSANSVAASPRGPGCDWRSAGGPKRPRRVFIPAQRRGAQKPRCGAAPRTPPGSARPRSSASRNLQKKFSLLLFFFFFSPSARFFGRAGNEKIIIIVVVIIIIIKKSNFLQTFSGFLPSSPRPGCTLVETSPLLVFALFVFLFFKPSPPLSQLVLFYFEFFRPPAPPLRHFLA